jgi:hypothetical protein
MRKFADSACPLIAHCSSQDSMLNSTVALLASATLAVAFPAQLTFLSSSPTSSSLLPLQHARPVSLQLGVMSRCPDARVRPSSPSSVEQR